MIADYLLKLSVVRHVLSKRFRLPKKNPFHKPLVIPVVCSINEDFAMPLSCMLASLIDHLNSKTTIDLYIFYTQLNPQTKLKIENLFPYKIKFIWTQVDPKKLLDLRLDGHISIETYFRLLIDKFLPSNLNKVIYLDADLIINTDISSLWNMPFKNKIIIAAPEYEQPQGFIFSHHGPNQNGLIFNSGVLVINLKKWRCLNISQKIINFLHQYNKDILWHDQEGLNAILDGQWKKIDVRWNLLTQMVNDRQKPIYKKAVSNPFIIHFNTSQKPWQSENKHPYKPLFLYYFKKINAV